jgi:hypothetical protein
MRAVLTQPYRGCLDGDVYPRDWPAGSELRGALAREAVASGAARWVKAHGAAPETAARPSTALTTGRTGRAAASSSRRRGPASGPKI